jgi:hypothetical protein
MAVLEPYPVLSNLLGEPVRALASPRHMIDVRLLLEGLKRKASRDQITEREFHFVAFSVQQHSQEELLCNLNDPVLDDARRGVPPRTYWPEPAHKDRARPGLHRDRVA